MPLKPSDELLVRKHSFDLKFDSQLEDMLVSHQAKLDRLRAPGGDLEKYTTDPDGMGGVKYELKQQFPELSVAELAQEFFDQQVYYIWKDVTLDEIVKTIPVEQDARARGIVDRVPIGTTYYVDGDAGNNAHTGTKISGTIDSSADTTHFVDAALTGIDDYINGSFFYNETTGHITTIADFVAATDTAELTDADASMAGGDTYYILHAWLDADQFTENARFDGDICINRRATTIDNGSDLLFTSDGTKVAPIKFIADNANEWRDNVDLSVTATATLTFGSKIITFSADVSSVVAAGDVIYVAAEDADEFAYEVDSVSTVTVTLFLPYKGDQDGSGKTMTNLQANPAWNSPAGNFQAMLDTDLYWFFQGIHFSGTDTNGAFEIDSSDNQVFRDCVFEGNGSGDRALNITDDPQRPLISKCRFFNYVVGILISSFGSVFIGTVRDSLFDGNSVASSRAMDVYMGSRPTFIDCELKNHALGDFGSGTVAIFNGQLYLRNCLVASTTEFDSIDVSTMGEYFVEDHNGALGDSRQLNFLSSSESVPSVQSDTGTLRAGGGAISGKCTPSTNMGTAWEYSRQLLFEIPFYAITASKKYEVFFRPTATADWTTDPTALELWIEIEYWGHASNNFRKITKSTGVIDMNGSTTFTALDVTVAPAQAGVAYLRGYYAKTKESGKANTFFWDVVPVVA